MKISTSPSFAASQTERHLEQAGAHGSDVSVQLQNEMYHAQNVTFKNDAKGFNQYIKKMESDLQDPMYKDILGLVEIYDKENDKENDKNKGGKMGGKLPIDVSVGIGTSAGPKRQRPGE